MRHISRCYTSCCYNRSTLQMSRINLEEVTAEGACPCYKITHANSYLLYLCRQVAATKGDLAGACVNVLCSCTYCGPKSDCVLGTFKLEVCPVLAIPLYEADRVLQLNSCYR